MGINAHSANRIMVNAEGICRPLGAISIINLLLINLVNLLVLGLIIIA